MTAEGFFRSRSFLGVAILLAGFSFSATGQKVTQRSAKPAGREATARRPIVVTIIDEAGLRKLLVPNGKPVLINFWATWCDPCREEFPDIVKLNAEFKSKVDFITVSLDDVEDISTGVPKFLASMGSEMPAFLLKTADESAAITSISKDWQGGMPFTILLNPKGETAYFRQGKINPETVRDAISKIIVPDAPAGN